jgi:NADP-dependent 3-hydroxy acid dehydrogenase YdfG
MDVSARGVRIINVEPGLVRTRFPEGSFRSADQYYAEKEYFTIEGKDVGATVLYAVEQPPRVSVSEILVRPTEQLK